MVPTLLNMVISHPSAEKNRGALSKWKVMVGGAACPRELAARASRLGIKLTATFGLSETAPVLTVANPTEKYASLNEDELLDAVLLKTGLPIPLLQLRVVDTEMNDIVRDNKTPGEIIVRGPWLTREYCKEEETARQLWRGGWLHTGDMAAMDEEGYVTIADRMKDAIKSGGEWIPTIILEDIITRHPAVYETAVIGVKDPKWEERPLAIVNLRTGMMATEEELEKHVQEFVEEGKIAKFWVPDRFVITTEPLPKTSTGKLNKKRLREKYTAAPSAS